MCIFTMPSVEVAETRIFARMTGAGTQLLVYEMSYAAAGEGAMILPLPVDSRDEEAAVKFIDMSGSRDFFDRLAELVLHNQPKKPQTLSISRGDMPAKPRLRVHVVGGFDASYVPALEDFARLDARFKLPDDVSRVFPQYEDYGFAVFKLRDTGDALKDAHPMAFEFSTRHADRVFIPTVHVHDGQAHSHAWFDHMLYAQGYRCSVDSSYFLDGGALSNPFMTEQGVEILRRMDGERHLIRTGRPDDDRFGLIQKQQTVDDYAAPLADAGMKRAIRRWQELSPEKWGKFDQASSLLPIEDIELLRHIPAQWRKLIPFVDPDLNLYSIGMSGLLPNTDTLTGVA